MARSTSSKRTEATDLVKLFEMKLGPASNWSGNCYAIACKVVKENLVPKGSSAVYGHWLGPVHEESIFYRGGAPFSRHGWVLLPDGTVCDPTRWVFEHVKPYIYFGRADHYDEGGNTIRRTLAGRPPEYDPDLTTYQLSKEVLPTKAWNFVEKLLRLDLRDTDVDVEIVSANQLMWLANRPPQEFGEHTPTIYHALDKLGLRAFVPYDNWAMARRLFKDAGLPA